jgi:hypothetical protein
MTDEQKLEQSIILKQRADEWVKVYILDFNSQLT